MVYDFKWHKPVLASAPDNNGLPLGPVVHNWQPRPMPPKQIANGKYCSVEPFNLNDHHTDLFQAFLQDSDNSNWTYLPYGPFIKVEEFKTWCSEQCIGADPLFHSIRDKASNKLVGVASYLRITPDAGSIEVGHIHFSPLMQRTKVATECMYLMMKRVFDELEYRRYEWKCNALNDPSCRAAERFGFQFEGIFRQAAVVKGQNRDTAWFSIIDSEWPRLREGYEMWLAESNFDEQDQQIKSLQACFNLL